MVIVFREEDHPRDGLGRFRETVDLRGLIGEAPEVGEEGWDRIDAAMSDWHASLSEEEAGADGLGAYVGTSNGAALNGVMRHGAPPPGFQATDPEHPDVSLPTLRRQGRAIDSALDKARLPESVTVFREFADDDISQAAKDGNLIGALVTDKGFMSTSTLPSWDMEDTPLFMAGTKNGDAGTQDPSELATTEGIRTFARVRIPEGARAAPVDRYGPWGVGERELLLQDGTITEVTDATLGTDKNGSTVLLITMDVVEQLGGNGQD